MVATERGGGGGVSIIVPYSQMWKERKLNRENVESM